VLACRLLICSGIISFDLNIVNNNAADEDNNNNNNSTVHQPPTHPHARELGRPRPTPEDRVNQSQHVPPFRPPWTPLRRRQTCSIVILLLTRPAGAWPLNAGCRATAATPGVVLDGTAGATGFSELGRPLPVLLIWDGGGKTRARFGKDGERWRRCLNSRAFAAIEFLAWFACLAS